jgi:hypothetical protein
LNILPNDPRHLPFVAALMVAADKVGATIELHNHLYIQVSVSDDYQMKLFQLIMAHLTKRAKIAAASELVGTPLTFACPDGRRCARWRRLRGH